MAYPVLNAPYGLKPVNLLGGQVFSGSTKEYPIPYGYNTNIFYGDFVTTAKGFANRQAVTTSAANTVGIFLGCSFTNPVTKQKMFSNYWPASTAASDAVAIVCNDPDTQFRIAACVAGSTTICSVARGMVGLNVQIADNAGVVATGNSRIALAITAPGTTSPFTTSTLPVTLEGVVPETAIALGGYTTATTAWTSTTITLGSALTTALPVGTEVQYLGADGQMAATGCFVTTAASVGATTVTVNSAPGILGGTVPIGSTVAFVQYQEAYVKLNFGQHQYYSATGVA